MLLDGHQIVLLIFSIMSVCILSAQGGGKWLWEAKVWMVATMVTAIKKKNKLVALIFSFASVNIKQGETC